MPFMVSLWFVGTVAAAPAHGGGRLAGKASLPRPVGIGGRLRGSDGSTPSRMLAGRRDPSPGAV